MNNFNGGTNVDIKKYTIYNRWTDREHVTYFTAPLISWSKYRFDQLSSTQYLLMSRLLARLHVDYTIWNLSI